MKRSTKAQFDSRYGFKSPGFAVDSEGNLTAKSLSVVQDSTTGVYDFVVTDDQANFSIQNYIGNNPDITLSRGRTYTFQLNLTGFQFFIKQADGVSNQVDGLTHSSGDIGVDAQGKSSGILSFTVPFDAESTLFYTNSDGSVVGNILVVDQEGLFSTINITSTESSTSTTTGALTVAGGVGIEEDLFIGGSLNIAGVGISKLESGTNLELTAANKILLKIDNATIGEINSDGLETTINNSILNDSVIDNSTVNNTIIGNTTPNSATFTLANITQLPTEPNNVTSKTYVDTNITALAIALGS